MSDGLRARVGCSCAGSGPLLWPRPVGAAVVTVLALHMGSLLGGTVLVEFVFNWPGLSGELVRAVEQRDYPEVIGIVLVISVALVITNLVVDLLYAVIDPRVRHG